MQGNASNSEDLGPFINIIIHTGNNNVTDMNDKNRYDHAHSEKKM